MKATVAALGMHGINIVLAGVPNDRDSMAKAEAAIFAAVSTPGGAHTISMGYTPGTSPGTVDITIMIVVRSFREDVFYADIMRQALAENAPKYGITVEDVTPPGRQEASPR